MDHAKCGLGREIDHSRTLFSFEDLFAEVAKHTVVEVTFLMAWREKGLLQKVWVFQFVSWVLRYFRNMYLLPSANQVKRNCRAKEPPGEIKDVVGKN